MHPRLIAFDLDRTLLSASGELSPYTLETLHACRARGILLAFATGRPLRRTAELRAHFSWDACIHHNGGIAHLSERLLLLRQIPRADALALLAALSAAFPGLPLTLECNDTLYADRPLDLGTELTVLSGFSAAPECDADKILLSMPGPSVYRKLSAMLPGSLHAEITDGKLILITHGDARKQNGVAEATRALGVGMPDVMAFGDDHNDVGMLRDCGVGIAMANAVEPAKSAADYVCGHHDEEGVARFIWEHVLLPSYPSNVPFK